MGEGCKEGREHDRCPRLREIQGQACKSRGAPCGPPTRAERLVNRHRQGAPRPRKPASRLGQLRGMWSGGWNGTETPPRPLCFHASPNDRGGKFTSGEGVAFSGVQLDTSRGATHQAAPFPLSFPLSSRTHYHPASTALGASLHLHLASHERAGLQGHLYRNTGPRENCPSASPSVLERPAARGAPHSPPAGLARPSTRAPCPSGPPGSRER